MKLRTKLSALALTLLFTLSAVSCSIQMPSEKPIIPGGIDPIGGDPMGSDPIGNPSANGENVSVSIESVVVEQPESPVSGEAPDGYDCRITLQSNTATVEGSGVTVNGNTVTITKAGKYLLSGSLIGQLQVNTEEDTEVLLYLNGVSITGDKNAAIYILSAPKRVTLSTVSGSKNILVDAEKYTYAGETEEPSACLYAKDDLRLEGEGELYVTSASMKGIYCKDDLKILSGTVQVEAADDGIRGKDSLTVGGGNITVLSGTDAFKASGDPAEGQGVFLMTDGTVHLQSGDDGIDAAGRLTVSGGTLEIVTGDGSSANTSGGGTDVFPGGGGGHRPPNGWGPWGNDDPANHAEGTGGKGIKSDTEIVLSGGSIKIDSYDDAVHATDSITFSGATLTASAGDDGVHCDKTIDIFDGTITVTGSYEGIEGQYITVSGGRVDVTARDDGFNATDGSASGGMGGRPGGFGNGQDALVTITGGYILINASGDGMDSNGNIKQTGGTVIIFGPSNSGNGAIDTGDGSNNGYFMEGGTVLAIGASGMAEAPEKGTVPVLSVKTSNIAANTDLYILDEQGNCVIAFRTPKQISSIVFASSELKSGKLTVYSGGTLPTLTDNVALFPSETPSGGKSLTSATV